MVEFLSKFRWRIKRVKVYALVGKTGTGKSFRARLITEKHKIDLVIDDGLLIRNHRILAGKSAKREKNRVSAIKRAVFHDPEHADEVQQALEKEKFRSILIIGISDKMIERIVDRLGLPSPEETIYIEDIATEEDITRAKEVRKSHGKHVIPVPMIEVRQDPAHRVLDSIKLFLERHPLHFWKKKVVEKTIVQPPFFRRGRLSISRAALSQMVVHCVQEYSENLAVDKIIIDAVTEGYRIEVKLSFPFSMSIPDTLAGLQEYIIMNIERYSGIHIDKLDLTADQIKKDTSPKVKIHRRKK
jgi:hypothetical protein